jgi:TonB family protein
MSAKSFITVFFMTWAGVMLCYSQASSQTCDLLIETSPADSETVLQGVFATLISRETSRIYKSTFKQGLPYFANMPEGKYKVTLKKVGYKRTIDNVTVSCDEAEDGVFTTFATLWRGPSTETVDLASRPVKEMRLDKIVRLGSVDSDTGVRVDDPNAPVRPPRPFPKTISGGVLNGRAISLPIPEYPPAAMAVRAAGAVSVQVLIDENGDVISASAVSGHPLLRAAAESAARGAQFSPTLLEGNPVKVSGVITYNFVP